MAEIVRLTKDKYLPTILSGAGASKTGGALNPVGVPAIYTSCHSSTAILESRVHLGGLKIIPAQSLVFFDIPDEFVQVLFQEDLPDRYRERPVLTEVQEKFAQRYFYPCKYLAFCVYSVVDPLARNVIINPNHPDIIRVTIKRIIPFTFDDRLF